MDFGLRPDDSQDLLGGPQADPGLAGRPQTLKTHKHDLERSGVIWHDLALVLGIIRARQLPLALRLPNPLITSKLYDSMKLFSHARPLKGSADL